MELRIDKIETIEKDNILLYENNEYCDLRAGIALLLDGDETQEGFEDNCQSIIESLLDKQKTILSKEKIELLVDFCKFHFMRFNLSNRENAIEWLINPYLKSIGEL